MTSPFENVSDGVPSMLPVSVLITESERNWTAKKFSVVPAVVMYFEPLPPDKLYTDTCPILYRGLRY